MANKKVKSDYLALKKFNQKTEKGDIFERDIMTINPLEDLFTPGQDVIYSDSNFKFSVRTDQDRTKKHTKDGWLKTPDGEEVWHLSDVDSSPISEESEVVIKPDYSSMKDFAYYGSAVEMLRAAVNHVIMYFPAELYFSEQTLNDYLGLVGSDKIPTYGTYKVIPNDFNINVEVDTIEESDLDNPYRYLCLHAINYDVYKDGKFQSSGVTRNDFQKNSRYSCGDGVLGTVTLTNTSKSFTITVYVYDGKSYLIYNDNSYKGYSIRPNSVIVNEYFATIDEFEKVLLNKETKPLYKAVFETPYETDDGNKYVMESYIWPSRNDWNPIIDGGGYEMYIGSLIKLATFHDEYDSNIIWRMLTHEAIKNLDWTFFRENGDNVEDLSKIDSSKIEAFLQLYGRQFDGLKRYIDSIKYTNNVTYDQKNNLPDYMLTDVVENSGFEAILPNATAKTDVISDVLYPSKSIGSSEVDANTQFMRNLKINAPYINSLKGTRYGVETMLKLLGLKDGEFKITEYVTVATGSSEQCTFSDDLSYGDNFYPRATGVKYPSIKDVISININKGDGTVDDMETYFDGIPVKPFRKMTGEGKDETYYAIPWYENGKHYDGGWYFQSKGGWAKKKSEKVDNPVVEGGVSELKYDSLDESIIYDESESSLKYADNVKEMKGFFKSEIKDRMVCYVTDLESWDEYSADVSSHYFIYDESGNTWDNIPIDEIRNAETPNGKKVVYLENIKESTEGNNPHISNDEYDDGKEYLEYMNEIFKYSLDNSGFTRFSQNDINKIKDFYKFNVGDLVEDNNKCDYFFNPNSASTLSAFTSAITVDGQTYASNPEGGEINAEPAANSIINVKNLHLEIKEEICSDAEANEKWKDYITNVVMNYVKQMLPSTTIFTFEFTGGTPEYYLKWSDGTTGTKTVNVNYNDTSASAGIKTNAPELSTSKSGIVKNVSTGSSVSVSFNANTSTSQKQGSATVSYGGSALTLTVIQAGKPEEKYIYITSNGQTTESLSVGSDGITSKSYRIITNYSQSELDNFTKNKPDWVNNLSLTTSNVSFGVSAQSTGASARSGNITFGGITISISQSAGGGFNMNVNVSSSSIAASTTSFGITISTNSTKEYTIYVNGSSIGKHTGTDTYSTTYTCGANTGTTSRTFTVSASNSDASDDASVTQNGVSESLILKLNNTHGNITIDSGVTSFTIKVEPSANDFNYVVKVDGTTQWSNLTGTTTNTYTCGANPNYSNRTFTIQTVSNNASEQFTVTQNAKEAFKANLKVNNSTSPSNIGSGTTGFTISTTPNDSSKSYTIYVNGTSFTSTTGNYSGSYSCGANPDTSERTFTVTCEGESVTIKQNGQSAPTRRRVTLNIVGGTNVQIVNNTGVNVSLDLRGESTVGYFDDMFDDGPIDVGAYQTQQVSIYGTTTSTVLSTDSSINLTLRLKDGNAESDGMECTLTYNGSNRMKNNFQGGWCEFDEVSLPITPGTSDITVTFTINGLNVHE